MAKYIQIGALVEKEHGLEAYNNVSTSNGVVYALLETGRSNDKLQKTPALKAQP